MKDTRKNTKDTKKRKNKKTIWNKALFLKRYLQKEKKTYPHRTRKQRKKKRNMETYGNNNKSGKSRNKEDIFSDVNYNSKIFFKKKRYTKKWQIKIQKVIFN